MTSAKVQFAPLRRDVNLLLPEEARFRAELAAMTNPDPALFLRAARSCDMGRSVSPPMRVPAASHEDRWRPSSVVAMDCDLKLWRFRERLRGSGLKVARASFTADDDHLAVSVEDNYRPAVQMDAPSRDEDAQHRSSLLFDFDDDLL